MAKVKRVEAVTRTEVIEVEPERFELSVSSREAGYILALLGSSNTDGVLTGLYIRLNHLVPSKDRPSKRFLADTQTIELRDSPAVKIDPSSFEEGW
jgi:hypothetical protein